MRRKLKFPLLFPLLLIVLILTMGVCISVGTMKIPVLETYKILIDELFHLDLSVNPTYAGIILKIRLPRVLMGLVVGAGLALCGVIMQAIVQNPLADPFILGISSGGYLGATIFIILGGTSIGILSGIGLSIIAFFGALIATIAVLFLSSYNSKITTTKLILSGTIISAACSAAANFIIAISGTDSTITQITFWTMGSLSSSKWDSLLMPLLVTLLCLVFFMTQYRPLNAMLQGDETAITLGINIQFYRKLYIIIVALLTGILVSTCGIIGFVGLVIPHISRALTGANHRSLIIVSTLLGSIFLMWVDAIARTIVDKVELPIGIFTALVGAPFFAYIMIRKNYNF